MNQSGRMENVRLALDNATAHGLNIEMIAAALAEVEEWEARLARLMSRGIEDLHHSLAEAEAEADRLKAALTEIMAELPISQAPGGLPAPIRIERALVIARAALAPADRNTT